MVKASASEMAIPTSAELAEKDVVKSGWLTKRVCDKCSHTLLLCILSYRSTACREGCARLGPGASSALNPGSPASIYIAPL